jgi:hypothetical protein
MKTKALDVAINIYGDWINLKYKYEPNDDVYDDEHWW